MHVEILVPSDDAVYLNTDLRLASLWLVRKGAKSTHQQSLVQPTVVISVLNQAEYTSTKVGSRALWWEIMTEKSTTKIRRDK